MTANGETTRRGQCLCGAVSFTTTGKPRWVAHCHCLSCRRNTGAALATFVCFPEDRLTFDGERSYYASSPGVRRGFCGRCGTPVSYEADRYPGEVHLYISAFDEPNELPAGGHVHFAERIAWFDTADDLPRKPGTGQ